MVDILVLDGRDERFAFLGLDGIITASCCPNCVTLSEGISNRFTLDGKSEILEYDGTDENYYSDEYLNAMAENRLVISEKERPLFYGAFNNDVNTIGGFANWVQDWEYARNPVFPLNGIGENTHLQSDVKPVTKALSLKQSYRPQYREQVFRCVLLLNK